MRRRLTGLILALLVAVVVLTVGKAVLFTASKGGDIGTPTTGSLLPLPDGVRLVAERSFTTESNLGAGIRLLVVETTGTATDRPNPAVSVLNALVARGWRQVAQTAAISPDGPCATVDTVIDYLADPENPVNTKQFLRDLGSAADGAGVVTAIFC